LLAILRFRHKKGRAFARLFLWIEIKYYKL